MNIHTKARLADLYPELARRGSLAIEDAAKAGFTIEVIQGVRTWPEQHVLWCCGRDPFTNRIVDPKKVVTHAMAGESYHNYGLAFDFAPFDENHQPIWKTDFPGYAKFIEIAESYGLVSGSHWPLDKVDFPHLQLTGRFPENAPDVYCKYLFKEGGFAAVWKEVDINLGLITT